MSGGGSSKAPDTVGAAREQGRQARWLAREETLANRPNQVNPWGSTTWTRTPVNPYGSSPAAATQSAGDGSPVARALGGRVTEASTDALETAFGNPYAGSAATIGQLPSSYWDNYNSVNGNLPMYEWTQTETLNPELQASLDAQFEQQRGRSELAASMLPQLQQDMGTPMDWDQYGDPISFDPTEQRQAAEDAAYQRQVNRLDPQYQQQAEALEVNLRNKGLRPGDQAYDAAMQNFGRTRNDAYEQARLGSTAEGRQEVATGLNMNERANQLRSQQIQEDLYKRGYTLEQINALMAGQEIEGSSPSSSDRATIADIASQLRA